MKHMKLNKTLFDNEAKKYVKKLEKIEQLNFKDGLEDYTFIILMSDGKAYVTDSNFEDEITEITRYI